MFVRSSLISIKNILFSHKITPKNRRENIRKCESLPVEQKYERGNGRYKSWSGEPLRR
jgi:hypothetical protein